MAARAAMPKKSRAEEFMDREVALRVAEALEAEKAVTQETEIQRRVAARLAEIHASKC